MEEKKGEWSDKSRNCGRKERYMAWFVLNAPAPRFGWQCVYILWGRPRQLDVRQRTCFEWPFKKYILYYRILKRSSFHFTVIIYQQLYWIRFCILSFHNLTGDRIFLTTNNIFVPHNNWSKEISRSTFQLLIKTFSMEYSTKRKHLGIIFLDFS